MVSSTWRGVLTLALIAPAVAMVMTTPIWGIGVYFLVIPIAVASSLLVGGPMLSLALTRGWQRLYQWAILGTIGGALPVFILTAVLSIFRGPTKMDGVVYTRLEPLAIVIGSVSAVTFWLLTIQSKFSRRAVVGLLCLIVLAALFAVCGLLWSDGWVPTFHGAHRRWT